jgi:O-antigen ligase
LFRVPNVVFLFLIFWGWMLFTLTYTKSDDYSFTKTLYFGTNLIPIYFFLVKSNDFNIRLFLRVFVLLQLAFVLIYFPYAFEYYKTWNPKLSDLTRMYLSLAENTGLVFLSLYLSREYIFSKLWDNILKFISFLFLIGLSARGPLFFVLFIILIDWLINFKGRISLKFNKRLFYFFSLVLVSVILISIVYWDLIFTLLKTSFFRIHIFFESIFSQTNMRDSSISMRFDLINKALSSIFSGWDTFIFGKGIGSFGIETFGVDSRIHPHNNIIEIIFELGFIGLIIYLLFFTILLAKTKIKYKYISYLIILYSILNILKSNSLIDIRVLLSFVVLNTLNSNKSCI